VPGVALPENLGIPAGRNRGVEHVTGEYLFFLDDDVDLDVLLCEDTPDAPVEVSGTGALGQHHHADPRHPR